MSVTAIPVSSEDLSRRAAVIPAADTRSFEERWAAWLARGAAHDRAVRRRMMFGVPTLAIVAAVLYVLLTR
jgi:hypothetical protein